MSNTVSITADSQTVAGTLTSFVAFPGDTFNCAGLSVPIQQVVSTSEIRLAYGWPGASVTNSDRWTIVKTSPQWSSAVQIHESVQEALAKISGGFPIGVSSAGRAPKRPLYNDMPEGFTFLQTSATPIEPFQLFVKESDASGDWSVGQSIWRGGGGGGSGGGFTSLSIGTVTTGSPGSNAAASITGTATDPVLNFSIPRGNNGPAPELAMGTVTTGAPGSAASATLSGSGGAYSIGLTIPRGDRGPVAAFVMGSVSTGAAGTSAEASIGGTAENPALNLVLPRGPAGPAPGMSIGSVTTGTPGSSTSVSITGSSGSYALNFQIPRGDVGPTPMFEIGTVTTGTAGSNASATITGTPESPLLNLTIPRGASGAGTGDMLSSNNLSDVADKATARSNLQLGSMAQRNVTVSSADPFGGADGDIWLKVSA